MTDIYVLNLAEVSVGELMSSLGIDEMAAAKEEELQQRFTKAIQEAIEQESAAIRDEWAQEAERTYENCVDSGMPGDSFTLERDK